MDIVEPIIFPPVLAEIARNAPRVSIECLPPNPGFADELRSGTIDLACFTYPMNPTEITAVPIGGAEITVVARKNHPGIRGKFTAKTFMSLEHIALTRDLRGMGNVEKDLVAHGLTRKIVYMVNRVWSIAPMVERSDLIAILPGSFAREISRNFDIELHPVPFKASEQFNYLMWHSRHENDAGHKWLREKMLAAVANHHAEGVKRAPRVPARQSKSGSRPRRRATA
jgi:DNA-binding transcriptional LysR family regulator